MRKTEEEPTPEEALELERRAEALRLRPAVAGADEALVWFAEFPAGEGRYAVPLDSLRAAVPVGDVVPVPLAARHVIGILPFEGQVVPALSLHTLLGAGGWRRDPSILIVVDAGGGRLVALDCERVPIAVAFTAGQLRDARARSPGALVPVATAERDLVTLVDVPRLLETVEGARGR